MKGGFVCNLALLGLLLNLSQNTIAAIGTITEQTAAVPSIQRSAKTLSGTKGTGIEMADSIKTTAGKAGIKFADDTQVQINENSKLVIDEFVYDAKNKSSGKLALNMASGTVRYASGAIAHNNPGKVAISTPTANIAVRGTDFSATVDELGQSTVILLPSCPTNYKNIEQDCKVGIIDVYNDAGTVTLDQAFQATRVTSRSAAPGRPVTLTLTEDAISNILILSPPPQLSKDSDQQRSKIETKNALDADFLKDVALVNQLDKQQKYMYQDKLSRNLLDQNFLQNILDIIDAQMAAQMNLLNKTPGGLLPDYVATSGIVAEVDDMSVTLSRDDGSNRQGVTVPKSQSTTIIQQQGSVEFKNRVNSYGTTSITLRQN
jgi:hypothetical protein